MSNSQRHKRNNKQVKNSLAKDFKLLFFESIVFLMSLFALSILITTSKQQKIKQLQEANQLLPRLEAKDKDSPIFLLSQNTLLHNKTTSYKNIYLSNIFIFSAVRPDISIFLRGNAQLKGKKIEKTGSNIYRITAYIKPVSNYYPKLLEIAHKDAKLFIPFIAPSKNKKSCIKNSKQKIYFMPGINQYLITTTNSKNEILNEMPYIYYFCNNQFVLEKNKITASIHWKTLYNNSDITIFSINNWLKIQLKSPKSIYLLLGSAKLSVNNINVLPYIFFYENNDNKFIYIKKSNIYNLAATKNINLAGILNNQNFSIKLKNSNYIQIFNLTLTKNQVIFITITVMLFIFNLILTKTHYQPPKFKTKKHV